MIAPTPGTTPGILRPGAPVRGSSGDAVEFSLDPREHRFLRDHLVDGRPLLSTVMSIETIGCAARALRPDATVAAVSDVQVGAPWFAPKGGPGRVEVTMSDAMPVATPGDPVLRCTLRDRSGRTPSDHLTADLTLADGPPTPPPARRPPRAAGPGGVVRAAEIYQLYFHGASFRVLDSAWLDGECLVGRLAPGLPPIVEPVRPSVTAPLLIELCLQTAGLWELAVQGRMMIPRSIGRVVRYTDADSATPGLTALVRPRSGDASPATYEFDADVVDERGAVHLTVRGYRTTEFPHPHDVEAAARIRSALLPG